MLDLPFLSKCSAGLQRHIIRRAVENLMPGQETVFSVLERASNFIADPAHVRIDLTGGLTLFREGDVLYIAKPNAELPFDRWPQMPAQKDFIGVSCARTNKSFRRLEIFRGEVAASRAGVGTICLGTRIRFRSGWMRKVYLIHWNCASDAMAMSSSRLA